MRKTNPKAEKVIKKIISPVEEFMGLESAGGLLLMAVTMAALFWANSPWHESYHHLVHMPLGFKFGHSLIEKSLSHWVNDGLMVIFFFVVGLEIKREMIIGELSSPRKAALPMFAALGGMIIPALLYVFFNHGTVGAPGWGIPMATDIAFALGILTLFSKRAPFALKVFLLALAIVDDLGAVLVIAFFYTEQISREALIMAGGFFVLLYILKISGIKSSLPYLLIGVVIWAAILKSGIHATIAGVIIGLITPIQPLYRLKDLPEKLKELQKDLFNSTSKLKSSLILDHETEHKLEELHHYIHESKSPLERLIHSLHPWVTFAIMPIFALVNAGVRIEGVDFATFLSNPISLGVIAGLVLGKPIGVLLATFLTVKFKIAELPQGVTWTHLTAVGFLAGIGFTMALFISNLALKSPELEVFSKLGILTASAISSFIGAALLNLSQPTEENA